MAVHQSVLSNLVSIVLRGHQLHRPISTSHVLLVSYGIHLCQFVQNFAEMVLSMCYSVMIVTQLVEMVVHHHVKHSQALSA